MGDSALDETQAELVERLTGAFQSVEELMQAVLEIARLDSPRMELNRRPVALRGLFARLAREYAPQAAAKGLRLVFADTRAVADSDPVLLRRITQNLVSNAIKYTRSGGVLVGVRHRRGRLWLEVRDSGMGIAADDRVRIFDEFHRGAAEGLAPGMGLGLAIVRRACAKLGHPIQLESQPGRGTVFRIGLPLAEERAEGEAEAAPPPRPAPALLAGLTVLLVENDPGLQRAYGLILRDAAGMAVHAAGSTAAALTLLEAAPDLRPDVILADYHLGGEDTGLGTIAAMRARLGPVPALMVTAHDAPDIARDCAVMGVPLLLKPVTAEALRAALCAVVPARPATNG